MFITATSIVHNIWNLDILRRDDALKAFGLSSSSSSAPLFAADVAATPGFEPSQSSIGSTSADYDWGIDCLDEDPEVLLEQPISSPPKEDTKPTFIEHMDESIGKPVRLFPDGSQLQSLDLVPEDDGFMWACWPDGSKTKTEMPVLLYKDPSCVLKRPSSCMIKKIEILNLLMMMVLMLMMKMMLLSQSPQRSQFSRGPL